MYKTEQVHYYYGELDIKFAINQANVEETDEAVNICDLTKVFNKYQVWKKNMPRIYPYYAVKCNDDFMVLKTLAKLGTGFDCASKNEIEKVLQLGVSPERIIFANPMKPYSHLKHARRHKIETSSVDNEFEIFKIFKYYPESRVALRFRSEAKKAQCPLGDKFGCDVNNEATALMLLAQSLDLNVTGVSFHVGSGCCDLPAYKRAVHSASLLFSFGNFIGQNLEILDIGGGFPGSDDNIFKKISDIVNKSIDTYFADVKVKVIAEPGRFFVSTAYTLVCKVLSKREIRRGNCLDTLMYYLNDGLYGSFNCILYDHSEVTAHHFLDANLPTFKSVIWGPTCDALDKISENLYLPKLFCGDLIAFENMGAYTVPIASSFNGFALPITYYFMKKAQ